MFLGAVILRVCFYQNVNFSDENTILASVVRCLYIRCMHSGFIFST